MSEHEREPDEAELPDKPPIEDMPPEDGIDPPETEDDVPDGRVPRPRGRARRRHDRRRGVRPAEVSWFVFPQAWIAPAIAAAAVAYGPVEGPISVKYRNLAPGNAGEAVFPSTIVIDRRPAAQWPKAKAQCVLAHEYGHLAGRGHSRNRASLMNEVLRPRPCLRWLRRHGL